MFRRLGLRSTFPSASSQNVTNWPKSSAARIKLSVLLSRPRYEIRIIRSCWCRILDSTRSRRLLLLLRCRHARSHYSPRPSHYDRSPDRPAWRITFGDCGIRSHQTPIVNRESLPPPCTQSPRLGSADRRLVFAVDPAETSLAIGDRIQTIHSVEFPSSSGAPQIPIAVFAKTPSETWAKGSGRRFNSCGC